LVADRGKREAGGGTQAGGVSVRPATSVDLAAIGRLGAMLVREHYDFDPQRFIAAPARSEQLYSSFLGGQLDDADIVILVAELDDKVLGYTYAGIEGYDYMALRGPAGVLYDIVVDPAHRGRGVGRMLLEATLETLKARGAPRVVLSTAEKNDAAQRLFDRAGFRRTMIEMTRELTD
jgi:ribosomal protein S18 acetylase RimI-like enzyme